MNPKYRLIAWYTFVALFLGAIMYWGPELTYEYLQEPRIKQTIRNMVNPDSLK